MSANFAPKKHPIARKAVVVTVHTKENSCDVPIERTFGSQNEANVFVDGIWLACDHANVPVPRVDQSSALEYDANYESGAEYPDYVPFPKYFEMALAPLARFDRVYVIKAIREYTGFGLKNAKDIADGLFPRATKQQLLDLARRCIDQADPTLIVDRPSECKTLGDMLKASLDRAA